MVAGFAGARAAELQGRMRMRRFSGMAHMAQACITGGRSWKCRGVAEESCSLCAHVYDLAVPNPALALRSRVVLWSSLSCSGPECFGITAFICVTYPGRHVLILCVQLLSCLPGRALEGVCATARAITGDLTELGTQHSRSEKGEALSGEEVIETLSTAQACITGGRSWKCRGVAEESCSLSVLALGFGVPGLSVSATGVCEKEPAVTSNLTESAMQCTCIAVLQKHLARLLASTAAVCLSLRCVAIVRCLAQDIYGVAVR
ncbi:uncharacterized protein EMH_0010000 [Eimeria mitis]|uniref:Uncharacterized protein n=1 Tax=Eimeria mitis TaxID=44415 RepID=U6K894_9EIME|nr:uncharacterized protein EMH_0010000 [Eimeria mitis]CDJ31713.1 hypothetical protein EMH_0010000 [Eimeria mitis]